MRSEGILLSVGVSVCHRDSGSTRAIQVLKHAQMGAKPCFLGFKLARFSRYSLVFDVQLDLLTLKFSTLLDVFVTTLLIVNLFTTQEFQASHAIAKDHRRIRQNLAWSYEATTASVAQRSDQPSYFCHQSRPLHY